MDKPERDHVLSVERSNRGARASRSRDRSTQRGSRYGRRHIFDDPQLRVERSIRDANDEELLAAFNERDRRVYRASLNRESRRARSAVDLEIQRQHVRGADTVIADPRPARRRRGSYPSARNDRRDTRRDAG